MQPGDPRHEADARALASALQAALATPSLAEACRAVLREVQAVVPFAFGVVLRLREERATVAGLYPGGMAGIEPGVEWSPLDGAERMLLRLGEPSLDAALRSEATDRSPLTRLPAYGLRSALRVPLFHHGVVVGSAAIYGYELGAFGAREGIAFEQCMRALGARLGAADERTGVPPPESASTLAPEAAVAAPVVSDAAVPVTAPGAALSEPERLSVLAELVSGVAHELNNPLTTILGYAQLLPTLEGEDARRATSTIEQEAQRAGRVVRNLLYFARQHRPRVEPLDLNAVLRRVIDVRRYNFEAGGVRLEVRLDAIPELVGDQYQLEQVFLNVLTNAEQALPGGGTITIESGTSESSTSERMARVSVTDTGAGIPAELASRIFEPFFSTRGTGEGEGLGLSTAYGIVQAHGGRMTAEQAPGGGARLVVELPLPPEATTVVAAAAPAAPVARGAGERVLVVEPAAPVRALVAAILGSGGYGVRAVASTAEALQALAEGPVELVVVGADGGPFVEEVGRRWPRLRSRLLVITGGSEAPAVAAPSAIPPAAIARPFTAAELLGVVRAVLLSARD